VWASLRPVVEQGTDTPFLWLVGVFALLVGALFLKCCINAQLFELPFHRRKVRHVDLLLGLRLLCRPFIWLLLSRRRRAGRVVLVPVTLVPWDVSDGTPFSTVAVPLEVFRWPATPLILVWWRCTCLKVLILVPSPVARTVLVPVVVVVSARVLFPSVVLHHPWGGGAVSAGEWGRVVVEEDVLGGTVVLVYGGGSRGRVSIDNHLWWRPLCGNLNLMYCCHPLVLKSRAC
jgi:hypothetical protein